MLHSVKGWECLLKLRINFLNNHTYGENMNRRNFLAGCCIFPFFAKLRPTLADPVPAGYEIIDRLKISNKEYVLFRNLRL